MTWRELTAEQLYKLRDPLIIDVRSPCEHVSESIPDSINVPLLSDDERAEVGTIYKEQGEATARIRALKIISPKIPDLIDRILKLKRAGQPVVIHCWRGGLRSECVASLLSVIGMDCFRLSGGYKAWRRNVLNDLDRADYKFKPIILHGLTGVGKTEILKELQSASHCVLDLELLANHCGSVFGGMGLGAQPTQKNFEAALWMKLRTFGDEPVFLEAESRKIGKLALPDFIIEKISSSRKILVEDSIESRAQRIVDDYAGKFDSATREEGSGFLHGLRERLGHKRVQEIEELAVAGGLLEAVKILLVEYYDPLYLKQIERSRPFDLEVSSEDVLQAVNRIESWLKTSVGEFDVIVGA